MQKSVPAHVIVSSINSSLALISYEASSYWFTVSPSSFTISCFWSSFKAFSSSLFSVLVKLALMNDDFKVESFLRNEKVNSNDILFLSCLSSIVLITNINLENKFTTRLCQKIVKCATYDCCTVPHDEQICTNCRGVVILHRSYAKSILTIASLVNINTNWHACITQISSCISGYSSFSIWHISACLKMRHLEIWNILNWIYIMYVCNHDLVSNCSFWPLLPTQPICQS